MRLDLEQWRELAAPIYEVYPREPTEHSGVDIEIEEAEGLFLSRIATPAQMLVHDPATRKDVCHDYLLFERFFEGGGRPKSATWASMSCRPVFTLSICRSVTFR